MPLEPFLKSSFHKESKLELKYSQSLSRRVSKENSMFIFVLLVFLLVNPFIGPFFYDVSCSVSSFISWGTDSAP